MRRGGLLLALALLVAGAAGAGWWFGSPWWTLREIKAAAEKRDLDALSAHVDYPALRADLQRQIEARIAESGPLGALGRIRGLLAGGLVEALVRPEGVRPIFDAASAAAVLPAGGGLLPRASDMAMRRDGLDQFRMVPLSGKGAELVFRRHGLGWKLAGITLPPKLSILERQPEIGEGAR